MLAAAAALLTPVPGGAVDNGTLTVTIPLAERARSRRIEVSHSGAATPIAPATVDSV